MTVRKRTLSPAQRRVKKEAEPTRLRKNLLAPELGISRPTLDKYLAIEGAPTPNRALTYSIEAVADFIGKQKIAEGKVKGRTYYDAELARLKCEQLAESIARERGDWVHKSELSKTLIPLMGELGALNEQKFALELPARCKGRDTIEIAQIAREMCDFIAKRFRDGTKELVGT